MMYDNPIIKTHNFQLCEEYASYKKYICDKCKIAKFNYDIESTGGEWITSKRVNIYLCLNCNEYLFFGEDRIGYMYGYIDNINPLLNCNEMIIKKIIE